MGDREDLESRLLVQEEDAASRAKRDLAWVWVAGCVSACLIIGAGFEASRDRSDTEALWALLLWAIAGANAGYGVKLSTGWKWLNDRPRVRLPLIGVVSGACVGSVEFLTGVSAFPGLLYGAGVGGLSFLYVDRLIQDTKRRSRISS